MKDDNTLKVSKNFRKMAIRSVLSIILFLVTYFILIVLGLGLIALCGLAAYGLVALKFMSVTCMLAIGFLGMGFMTFFFLIKFIFSSPKKVDRSHLLKIDEKQQPELFNLIHEIVHEVKTNFPKQIYLSSDVNASVFYDSNFWSMFFPVRKNLQIGIGLMNSVSAIELKAILAHEFGHFSQRSMKVGSYVYNMNKVIYNMLYDNDNFSILLDRWSSSSSYFALFSKGSILVIRGIQYVLIKVYKVLNLNYMALSREMEFHADAVAARVTGSAPLANSLLRLELADSSLSSVFDYYGAKIVTSQKTNNFYPQQYFVMNRISLAENLPIENGLPKVSIDIYKEVKKTKLVLHDQWSSHPTTEERVKRLIELNQPLKGEYGSLSIDILNDKEWIQEMMTARLFENVTYASTPVVIETKDFITEYLKLEQENSYASVYKRYFDSRNPYTGFTANDFDTVSFEQKGPIERIFDDQALGHIRHMNNAISDKEILEKISNGELDVKTFDYEGRKYSSADTYSLIKYLDEEIKNDEEILRAKDIEVFKYFLRCALNQGDVAQYKERSMAYQAVSVQLDLQQVAYINVVSSTYFIHTTTPVEEITNNMFLVKKNEKPFKEQLKLLLESDFYKNCIDGEMKLLFEEYLGNDWKYFASGRYFDKEIEALFTVMSDYYSVINKVHFKLKKALLDYTSTLIPKAESDLSA